MTIMTKLNPVIHLIVHNVHCVPSFAKLWNGIIYHVCRKGSIYSIYLIPLNAQFSPFSTVALFAEFIIKKRDIRYLVKSPRQSTYISVSYQIEMSFVYPLVYQSELFSPINIPKNFTALWFDHSKYAPFSKWTLYDIEAESVLLPTAISIKVYLKNKHAASSLVFEVFVTVYLY